MKVLIAKKFNKELSEIPSDKQNRVKDFVYHKLPKLKSIGEIKNIKKLSGYKDYYRIRFGDYRLGLFCDNETVKVIAIMHRKEIYRYFP